MNKCEINFLADFVVCDVESHLHLGICEICGHIHALCESVYTCIIWLNIYMHYVSQYLHALYDSIYGMYLPLTRQYTWNIQIIIHLFCRIILVWYTKKYKVRDLIPWVYVGFYIEYYKDIGDFQILYLQDICWEHWCLSTSNFHYSIVVNII
jgi:hypothetical protein